MIPPSSPSGPITSEVSEWIERDRAGDGEAQRPEQQAGREPRSPATRGRATEEQDPAADQDAEDRAVSSSMSVPVPSGHGRAIS